MRTVQHDRARHDHLRRIQASIQSDVDVRPAETSGSKIRFVDIDFRPIPPSEIRLLKD